MTRQHRPQTGFTLIELLVMIAILGILAGVVVFAVDAGGGKSAREDCFADGGTRYSEREGCVWNR